MKILRLDLTAFGPFTQTAVDLSHSSTELHILYGPNEAGKSSALRAMHALLFGIPERTPDGFLHPYPRLRVGGTLQTHGGEAIAFIRRKGRTRTLRREDDEAVAEEAELQKILGGVDAALFSSLFGIDHGELVRGGEEIVSGGGDLGRAIFAAGSGMVHLRKVQEELLAEADRLFKPSGQKPRLNEALRTLSERRKALRKAELSGPEWAKHDKALDRALTAKTRVEAEIAAAARSRNRLQRIREALPLMARRNELAEQKDALADAVPLPDDFPDRRRELLYRLRMGETECKRAEETAVEVRRSIDALEADPRLLGHAEPIETLYRDLGSQQKAARDRAKLEVLRNALLDEEKEIFRGLRRDRTPDPVEHLRIGKADAARIRELAARYERTITRIEDTESLLAEVRHNLEAVERGLAEFHTSRPMEPLVGALENAESHAAREERLHEWLVELRSAHQKLSDRCHALGLDPREARAESRLFLPSSETIRRFEERMDQLEQRGNALDLEMRKTREAFVEIDRQMASARLDQDVPEEGDLLVARDIRDTGWQLAARRLRGETVTDAQVRKWARKVPGAAKEKLEDAFQSALSQSDEIADRLRREAERVAAKARLNADREAATRRLQQLSEVSEQVAEEKAEVGRRWADAWKKSGIDPGSPREMVQWALNAHNLLERLEELGERHAEAEVERETLTRYRKRLEAALAEMGAAAPEPGATLGERIREARRIVERESSRVQERKEQLQEKARCEKELAAVQSRRKAAHAERKEWAALWAEAVQPLGLDSAALPAEAAAVMEELNSLFEKRREASVLEKRIAGIDRDAAIFRQQVADLAAAACPELAGAVPEEAVLEMNRRLQQTRDAFSKRETLQGQLEQESVRIGKARAEIAKAQTRLGEMCRQAGCTDAEQLPEAERRSRLRLELEAEWKTVEDRLRALSAGASVASFLSEVKTVDPDELEGTLANLEEETLRLNAEKSRLDQSIGTEQAELARMDGSAGAAEIAEEIQMLLGRIEAEAERYARFRIAAAVLQEAVERFRQKHQGPVLLRASALFSRLTLGSFSGVRADFDDRGRPRVVGIRPSGDTVGVEGMSDGTADQLYLSFRLAGLERYLRNKEAMPLVVDDILLQFDDQRAASALQILSELSTKTQVLFFTHHRHLVDLAHQHLGPEQFCLHTLDPRKA